MKRVQKAAATLAALALTSAMVLPAGAETPTYITAIDGTSSQPVTASYALDEVYQVDIEWGSLTFSYEPGVWDKDNLTYKPDTENEKSTMGWNNENTVGGNNYIKISNKSNVNVGIGLDCNITDTGCKYVSGSFWDQNAKKTTLKDTSTDQTTGLASQIWMERADAQVRTLNEGNASFKETGHPSVAELYLCLVGRPENKIETAQEIGTVTITLSEDTGDDSYGIYYESGVTYNPVRQRPVTSRDEIGKYPKNN